MRWVILGAGAVGGSIGARLHAAGIQVVLVARGAHLDAIRRDGLRVWSPDGEVVHRVPAVATAAEADGDVLLLATKAQHAAEILATAPPLPLVVAQNGVLEAHLGRPAYGAMVWTPASHLEPGVVEVYASPIPGALDVGPWPSGTDAIADAVAADLRAAGFDSRSVPDVARWKYAKLLTNVGNAVEALCGPEAETEDIVARLQTEALACYAAAGIASETVEALVARCASVRIRPIAGRRRLGGSSWQSLARGTGNIEADALNGEIVRLGEAFGVPVPANRAVLELALEAAARRDPPGSNAEALRARILSPISRPRTG